MSNISDISNIPNIPDIPGDEMFIAKMEVPGYWDDHTDRFKDAGLWPYCKFNPDYRKIEYPMEETKDASLPYIVGTGWYRTQFFIDKDASMPITTLQIGGVMTEAWIWVNRNFAGHHFGYSTPFELRIDKYIKKNEINELIIAVSNRRRDRLGCATRGFKGFSAGIYRSVYIKQNSYKRIKSCYIYPIFNNKQLNWQIELDGEYYSKDIVIYYKVQDPDDGNVLTRGLWSIRGNSISKSTPAFNLQPWSDKSPKLYLIELELWDGKHLLDTLRQNFGMRTVECCENKLKLNGKPLFLRGATEHCYYPVTCTPPRDIDIYRNNIKKIKKLGFNWLRFHTWVPSEEYMQAADELGMMIQVEPPKGFGLDEWTDILLTCRKHPSVIIYCCGNEDLLDEDMISFIKNAAELTRKYVPDGLFSPQEALRGVEYGWTDSDMGERKMLVEVPFVRNRKRLESLKEFSDVFGQWTWGMLSYSSSKGDWREIDKRLQVYEKPCLSHETGIYGSYMDLELEDRYIGTRIGTELYSSLREYLKREGVLSKANLYYKNSCAWMRIMRKHNLEMARKCKNVAGYNYLGAIDHHWHRTGYPSGIMNEFYEMKPGETVADVLKYNGESVLLLDHSNMRNFYYGDTIRFDILASLFGNEPLCEGILSWYLADEQGEIYVSDKKQVFNIENGQVNKVAEIKLDIPTLNKPSKLTIHARLQGDEYDISNDWNIWAFPRLSREYIDIPNRVENMDIQSQTEYIDIPSETGTVHDSNRTDNICIPGKNDKISMPGRVDNLRIVNQIDYDVLRFLCEGGRVLLLGSRPFKSLPVSFQLMSAGRPFGNYATVIYEHPVIRDFPHDGYCDWQFYSMMEDSQAVLFNDLDIPFEPIIEVVSSFKSVKKQAGLFEVKVGEGALLVFSYNIDATDPAGTYMFECLLKYSLSSDFNPSISIEPDVIANLITDNVADNQDTSTSLTTDQAFDRNAQIDNKEDR